MLYHMRKGRTAKALLKFLLEFETGNNNDLAQVCAVCPLMISLRLKAKVIVIKVII